MEPRVFRVAALELVRADDAAGPTALDLQRLPHEHVLVVGACRQHQQAACGCGVDRVLERVVGFTCTAGGAGTVTTFGVYVTVFVPVPFVPRT